VRPPRTFGKHIALALHSATEAGQLPVVRAVQRPTPVPVSRGLSGRRAGSETNIDASTFGEFMIDFDETVDIGSLLIEQLAGLLDRR
jgi:hypothetical protein